MFLLKGFLGILFGLLLITVPDFTLGAFLTLFGLLLIAAGFISFLFAVTSRMTDTLFWFLVSAGIVILGILTFIIPDLFAIVFAVIIAGWALITGAWDLDRYLCSKRKFYAIVASISIASIVLLAAIFYYLPVFRGNFLPTICGVFAVVFGIFALVVGQAIIRNRMPACLQPAEQQP